MSLAAPLAETITASGAKFKLSAPGGNPSTKSLQIDFTDPAFKATVAFNPGVSWTNVKKALLQLGIPTQSLPTQAAFEADLGPALTTALASKLSVVKLPGFSFVIVPSSHDGGLGTAVSPGKPATPPSFAQAEARTIAAVPNERPGVLCVLLTLFHFDDVAGDVTTGKTIASTDVPNTGSLTISPSGFQNLFIAMAQASGQLPAGTTITTALLQSQSRNQIGLHVAGTKSGTGYSAAWTIDGVMLASISNGGLALSLTDTSTRVSVSIDWWAWVVSVALFGVPAAVTDEAIQSLVAHLALNLVENIIPTLASTIGAATTTISGVPVTFQTVTVGPEAIILQGMAQMPPLFGTVVQGMVTDASEAPLIGATVVINPPGQNTGLYAQTATDHGGRYKFDTLPLDVFNSDPNGPRLYPIIASHTGYITDGGDEVPIDWGKITTLDFVLQKVADITVEGHVLASGAPAANATVTLSYGEPPDQVTDPASAQVDASTGFYSIKINPDQYTGGFTVSAAAPGFLPHVSPIGQIANGATVQEDFALVSPHPFTVVGNISLAVSTINDTSVGPVAGATVRVFPAVQSAPQLATYSGQTDQNGNYSIGPVIPGGYSGDYTVLTEVKLAGSQKQEVLQPIGASLEANFQFERTLGPPPGKPGTAM